MIAPRRCPMENQRIVGSFGDHTHQLEVDATRTSLAPGQSPSSLCFFAPLSSTPIILLPRPSKSEYLLIHPVIPPIAPPSSLQPSSSSRVSSIPLPFFITSLPFTASFHPLLSSFALSSTRSFSDSDLFRNPQYSHLVPHHIAKAQQFPCKAKAGLEIVHLLSKSCVLLAESYLHSNFLVLGFSNLQTPSVTHRKPSTSNELWDPQNSLPKPCCVATTCRRTGHHQSESRDY
ncbi:hypothetical protein BJY00DRAFT_116720 [Aspergillus carlsbadensis]|nr:hypothetical protein BJY00DRAFT_116720 [Aspergillus carlsbadensis]